MTISCPYINGDTVLVRFTTGWVEGSVTGHTMRTGRVFMGRRWDIDVLIDGMTHTLTCTDAGFGPEIKPL